MRMAPRVPDRIDYGIRRVMEKHSPAYVVIDRNYEILRFSGGDIARYLEPSPGAANLNLFRMVRKALRPALRAAVQKAEAGQEPVTIEKMAIKIDGKSRSVTLSVEPLAEGGAEAGLCVLVFQDVPVAVADANAAAEGVHPDLQVLEQELHTVKAQLQATIDDLETANEEMRSANEEYQSVNEELQSSNEELETAKEEMQSVNEELQTINAELSSKNETMSRLNSDLRNLLESTQIATLFLDENLRIKAFTAGMTELFHLRDSDRGRPITEIVTRLRHADLQRDVKKVLRDLSVVEREVQVPPDEATFIMRIRPYRTVDNVIDGVVITFVDITERKRYEEARAQLSAIIDSSQDAIIGHAFNGLVTSWNAGAERIFGYTADEAIGKPLAILLPEDQTDEVPQLLDKLKRGKGVAPFEINRIRKDGKQIPVSLTMSPVKDASGRPIAASTIARDITARRLAEDHKNLLIAELDHRVKNTLMIVTSLIAQTVKTTGSPEAFADNIEGRIQALSRVHHLLTQNNWDRADLGDVVMGELAPYAAEDKENIIVGGRDIVLTQKTTLALAMALHELATNAAKYGALSRHKGRVEVKWRVANTRAEPRLSLIWTESGGPRVKPPARRGFGSQLIERTLAYELQADVEQEFRPEGLRCRIEFALTDKTGFLPTGDHERT
jgi:two-component system CheB/CheR fusion protein